MKRLLLLTVAILLLRTAQPSAQIVRNFTDDDYQKVLREEPRVLFYSVSPAMPLSVEGLKEVRRAAEALHATLVMVADPAASTSQIESFGDSGIRYQKSGRLRNQGIELHYPSLIVADNHKVSGPPIAGYKTYPGYVTLVSNLLKLPWTEGFELSDQVALPRPMAAFFKPVYGTDFIVSGNAGPNYLFNLRTKDVFNIAHLDWGDPGPTPDGEFVTLLGTMGLSWYSMPDILTNKSAPLLWDPGLRTYQSVAQLSPTTYRVLGAVSSSSNPTGLIVRDYKAIRRDAGGKTVTPTNEWHAVCDDKQISIPMMSKTSRFLSGSYQGTLRIFRLGLDATECEEVFDTQLVAGKADFSRDDQFIIYVARSQNPDTRETVDTIYLADLRKATTKPIFYGDFRSHLAFPGFMSNDRIVAYEQTSKSLLILDRVRFIQ